MKGLRRITSRIVPSLMKRLIHRRAAYKKLVNLFREFEKSGKTPEGGRNALVSLFCKSDGADLLKFDKNHVPKSFTKVDHTIGLLKQEDVSKLNKQLIEEGYCNFEYTLNESLVDNLFKFALSEPCKPDGLDNEVIFDNNNLQSEVYRFSQDRLANNTDIQRLIMDETLIKLATAYLGSTPIFDFPAMWWSTAYNDKPSERAAQFYHFDLDRLKWLKVFFYLTDVDDDNGPHCYISGSHKPGSKPRAILDRGYARIPDEDLALDYREDQFKVLKGSKGSIFAGDTKCWHKGMKVNHGTRLVLELEYTTSLFGMNYDKLNLSTPSKDFEKFCKENPFYSSNIQFSN